MLPHKNAQAGGNGCGHPWHGSLGPPSGRGGPNLPVLVIFKLPEFKLLSNGSIANNNLDAFMSLPLTRYSLFAHGHYNVNENAQFYVQASFDENQTKTQSGAYAPAVNQWSVLIPRDASHPIPDELATILDSRANPDAPWQLNKNLTYMPTTSLETTTNTYELLAGVRGAIPFRDWTYDIFGSHGRTTQAVGYEGFADLGAYQTLISMPNYGAGAEFNNARIGRLATCTSGLNPSSTRRSRRTASTSSPPISRRPRPSSRARSS